MERTKKREINGSDAQTSESIAKGSQDLQILIQDILSELQPSVDTVYAKFADKYQWTSQAIEGSNLSKKSVTKKRYIVKEDLDLDTGDLYGISADEIDAHNIEVDKNRKKYKESLNGKKGDQ